MKLSGKDLKKLRRPPDLDGSHVCVFCGREQPEAEAGDGGGWAFFAGTMGHMGCPQCCEARGITTRAN